MRTAIHNMFMPLSKSARDERMRAITPAYRKIVKVILSCETSEHLSNTLNMVHTFRDRFPYAERFTMRLNSFIEMKHAKILGIKHDKWKAIGK